MISRRTIVKLLFVVLMALFGFVLVLHVTKQVIPPLTFPDPGPAQLFEFELRTHADFSEAVEVYKMVSKKVDQATFIQIANKFSMHPKEGNYSYTPFFGYFYKEDNYTLFVDDSGQIMFDLKITSTTDRMKPDRLPTDADVEKIATDFLKQRELLPSDFFFTSVSEGLVSVSGGDEKRVVESKQAWFHRKVDGKNVFGVSRIKVEVGDQGMIKSIAILYHKIQPYRKIPLKTTREALNDLRNGKGMVRFDVSLQPKKCFIDKIELAYFEQPDAPERMEQSYLYPVYCVTGRVINEHGKEGEYFGVVSALKEGMFFGDIY